MQGEKPSGVSRCSGFKSHRPHQTMDEELIKTLEQIRRDLSEPSFSGLVRRLLKERLGELGILNEDARKALGLTRVKDSQDV